MAITTLWDLVLLAAGVWIAVYPARFIAGLNRRSESLTDHFAEFQNRVPLHVGGAIGKLPDHAGIRRAIRFSGLLLAHSAALRTLGIA